MSGDGPDRLDALATATKEYASFSRSRAGLAHAVYGGWLLAAVWALKGTWPRTAEILYVCAPLVWLGALAKGRAYYQRRGGVQEREEDWSPTPARATALVLVYLNTVFALWFRSVSPAPPLFGELLVIAALVATPLLTATVTRGIADSGTASLFAVMAAFPPRGPARPGYEYWRWGMTAVAALFLARGLAEHRRFRRLERCLAAMKGEAR